MAVGSMHKNRLERRLANQQRGIVASTYSTTAGTGTSGTGVIPSTPSPAPAPDPNRNPMTGKQYGQPGGSGYFGPTSGDYAAVGIMGGRPDDKQTDYRILTGKKQPKRQSDPGQPWYQNER